MVDVNKIILLGRLGNDPTQRQTKTGASVVNFSVATSRKYTVEEEGVENRKEETQWHRVVAWGKQADHCAQQLKKGSSVYVEGSVRTRQYDAQDGSKKIAIEVHADKVSFLGHSKKSLEAAAAATELSAAG